MSVEHERVKEILAEAATKDTPEARVAYLDAACGGDAGLRQQVEGLLAAHDEAGDFLKESVLPPPEPSTRLVTGGSRNLCATSPYAAGQVFRLMP